MRMTKHLLLTKCTISVQIGSKLLVERSYNFYSGFYREVNPVGVRHESVSGLPLFLLHVLVVRVGFDGNIN